MDHAQLKRFVAAARHLHFAHAARELGIPRPTLIQAIAEMEAELSQHGVFNRGSQLKEPKDRKLKGKEPERGVDVLASKMANVNVANSDDDESSDDEALDIDYNLAKNLLESFKSQGGMAGPAGNILGMMGIQLPRDEDDEEQASSSRK